MRRGPAPSRGDCFGDERKLRASQQQARSESFFSGAPKTTAIAPASLIFLLSAWFTWVGETPRGGNYTQWTPLTLCRCRIPSKSLGASELIFPIYNYPCLHGLQEENLALVWRKNRLNRGHDHSDRHRSTSRLTGAGYSEGKVTGSKQIW
ncbi:hypothetical protein H4582DRAFT_1589764 [Lactarius indigo]|nr:hypothetical protein H4582DRAFT_1589764 [Lactarius indigo]